jgi:uncharacterized protein (DUF1778 family)
LRRRLSGTSILPNTLLMGAATSLCAVIIGGAVALMLVRTDLPGRATLEPLTLLSLEPEMPVVTTAKHDRRLREERPGFRVDEPTKALIERAAQLERRKLTDFCITALTDAAHRTIAEHEMLVLSDRNRAVFFDALVNPPAPSERLQRAFAEHKRRVVP